MVDTNENRCAAVRAFVTEKPKSIDPDVVVEKFFGPSGEIGGLSLGMTLDEVTALGFETRSYGDSEHFADLGPGVRDGTPRHDFEFALEDKVLVSLRYELSAADADVIAVEERFSDALENLLGSPIVVLGVKHWMFGDDAQFILTHELESKEEQSTGGDFGFVIEPTLGFVSLQLWTGEDGVFPGSFDPTGVEQLVRDFVDVSYGDQIKLGPAKIWMERPYLYFNLVLEKPDDELDFDWDGIPMSGDVLVDDFQALLKDEFDHLLDSYG